MCKGSLAVFLRVCATRCPGACDNATTVCTIGKPSVAIVMCGNEGLRDLAFPVLTLGANDRREGYRRCPVCVCVCVCACVRACVRACMRVCVYVGVCVPILIFHLTHWNHKREIPTDSSQYRSNFAAWLHATKFKEFSFGAYS